MSLRTPKFITGISEAFVGETQDRLRLLNDEEVPQIYEQILPTISNLEEHSDTIDQFTDIIKKFLAPKYWNQVATNLKRFGEQCENPALADEFIAERKNVYWITLILSSLIRQYYFPETDAENTPRDTVSAHDSNIHAEPAGNTSLEDPLARSPTKAPPIHQITLTGKTLKQAWINSEEAAALTPIPRNFDPGQPSSFRIFHGTSVKAAPNAVSQIVKYGLKMSRASRKNEMLPSPCLHTSFYPVRSFLWATFKSNFCCLRRTPSARDQLGYLWHYEGQQYKGILLVSYEMNTPSPPGLRAHVFDQTQVEDWSRLVELTESMGGMDSDEFWNTAQAKNIHQSNVSSCPDVIHAPERTQTVDALGDFIAPNMPARRVYRSAFISPAAEEYLQAHVSAYYAVAFEESVAEDSAASTTKSQKTGKRACKWLKKNFTTKK